MSTSLSLTRLMRWPNSVTSSSAVSWSIVWVSVTGDAHLEQGLDQVGAALGHAVGEFLHGDRLGNDDVADLLGRRARLHVVALFLLAGAAERGERTGAAVVLVGRARVTVSLPRWRWSSPRPRLGRAGSGRRGPVHGRRGGGRRARPLAAAGAAAFAARPALRRRGALLPRRFRRACLGGLLPRPCDFLRRGGALLGRSTLIASSRRRASSSEVRRDFLGLAQQLGLHFLAGGDVVGGDGLRRGRRGSSRLRRRLGRFGDGRGRRRLGRGRSFARAAEDAALLDLDDDRVGTAVAEALLDLAGLDRALEAQRRPGAKLRFFGLVCHSIPSSNLVSRAGPQGGFAAFKTSIGASESPPPGKRVVDTRSGSGIGQGDMYHILAPKCHGQDSAVQGEYHPSFAPPPPTRQAWSSLRSPSSPASAAWISRCDLARAGGLFDPVGAVDEVAGARLHAEAVERGLAKRSFDALAEVGGDGYLVGLERALQRGLELALGVGVVELGAADADPGAAARSAGANVGCTLAVGAEREPDQLVARSLAAGEDARPLGDVRIRIRSSASGLIREDSASAASSALGAAPRPRTSARGRP